MNHTSVAAGINHTSVAAGINHISVAAGAIAALSFSVRSINRVGYKNKVGHEADLIESLLLDNIFKLELLKTRALEFVGSY